jgi:hypothetical protein
MVKYGILFEVRTRLLNTIKTGVDTGFLGLYVFKQMLRWFPSSMLLLHASHEALQILNSSKLSPVVDAAKLLAFPNYRKVITNSKFHYLLEDTSP